MSQAIRAARQDYLLNPSNREKSAAMLRILGDNPQTEPKVHLENRRCGQFSDENPFQLLDEQHIKTADN